jgi:hypothetical protein
MCGERDEERDSYPELRMRTSGCWNGWYDIKAQVPSLIQFDVSLFSQILPFWWLQLRMKFTQLVYLLSIPWTM